MNKRNSQDARIVFGRPDSGNYLGIEENYLSLIIK